MITRRYEALVKDKKKTLWYPLSGSRQNLLISMTYTVVAVNEILISHVLPEESSFIAIVMNEKQETIVLITTN